METSEATAVAGPDRTIVAVAWTGILLGSYLPAIIWREIFRGDSRSDLVFRLAVLTAMVALTNLWRPVRVPCASSFSS